MYPFVSDVGTVYRLIKHILFIVGTSISFETLKSSDKRLSRRYDGIGRPKTPSNLRLRVGRKVNYEKRRFDIHT